MTTTRNDRFDRVDLLTLALIALTLVAVVWSWTANAGLVALPSRSQKTPIMSTAYEPVLDAAATEGVETYEQIRMAARKAGYEITPDREPPPLGTLLIADFDRDGVTERELDPHGIPWTNAPGDRRVVLRDTFDTSARIGVKGFALALDYDLAVPGSRAGYTLRLTRLERIGIDATPYKNLVLMLRQGDQGGPRQIRIDLKSATSQGSVMLANIGPQWQTFTVPLSRFTGVTDWRAITEISLAVVPSAGDRTRGTLLVEDVRIGP